MNASPNRSPLLLSRQNSALLVVDIQDKLISLTPNVRRLVWNARRLLNAAKLIGVPVLATEQYPARLGSTTEQIAQLLGAISPKLDFSCAACDEVLDSLTSRGVRNVLIVGVETHVCIQQSALDLLHLGFQPYLAVDGVDSRSQLDHDVALRRMDSAGATLTTTEAVLFEWCERAGSDEFKQISQLVREAPPE